MDDRTQEIRELARHMCRWYDDGVCRYPANRHGNTLCTHACEIITDRPEKVYNAGYRKQKFGKWIVTKTERCWNCAEYPSEYTCSLCGRTEPQPEPYCHCGAKMKGVSE